MECSTHLGHHQKTKEGEEIQTKGLDSLLNNITAENFPNLEKGRDIQVHKFIEVIKTIKETTLDIIKTVNIQNKERTLKVAEKKIQVTYNDKPIRITADSQQEC
jgi:hypothetical protein